MPRDFDLEEREAPVPAPVPQDLRLRLRGVWQPPRDTFVTEDFPYLLTKLGQIP